MASSVSTSPFTARMAATGGQHEMCGGHEGTVNRITPSFSDGGSEGGEGGGSGCPAPAMPSDEGAQQPPQPQQPPKAKRRRTSCSGEECNNRTVMPMYLCVPMLLLAFSAASTSCVSAAHDGARGLASGPLNGHGPQRRPVAPSRPRGAPDVDYGGGHPFDRHRHLWDGDFADSTATQAGLRRMNGEGRWLKKDEDKDKDKDEDKDKEDEKDKEEEEDQKAPQPTPRPTRRPVTRRPTSRPTENREDEDEDEDDEDTTEFKFQGADTSSLSQVSVAAATSGGGGDTSAASSTTSSAPADFATTTLDPATDAAYRPLRVQFDTRQLAEQMDLALSAGDDIAATKLYLLIYEILPMTAQVWGDILRVIPVTGGIYPLAARGSGVDQLLPNGQNNENDATTGDEGEYVDDPVRLMYCPDETTSGIEGGADLLIYATVNRHCPGNGNDDSKSMGTLASALSCQRDQYDRPITGSIDFCLERMRGTQSMDVASEIRAKESAGYAKENHMVDKEGASMEWDGWGGRASVAVARNNGDNARSGRLDGNEEMVQYSVGVAVHEIGHVLGVTSDSLAYFRHPLTGHPLTRRPFEISTVTCVNGEQQTYVGMPGPQVLQEGRHEGTGSRYFEVVTPTVKRVVQNHFNCPSLTGAKLENQPTSDNCFGSHWDESLYYTEIMGGVLGQGVNILSPLTLALLEDSGWYRANYDSGYVQISVFGHGMGCDFIDESCIDSDGNVPEVFEEHFCNTPIAISSNGNIDPNTSGAQTCDPSHTQKTYCDLVNTNEVNMIGKTGTTLEPAPEEFQYFSPNYRPYVFTNADYCPVPHLDPRSCVEYGGRPVSDEQLEAGEYYGPDSRCVETDGTREYSLCLRTRCNRALGKVQITAGGERRTCDYDGQVHEVLYDYDGGGELRIKCPKASLVCPDLFCPANCAGRGECRYASDVEDDDADDDVFYDSNARARCVCDSESDDSPGCFGTALSFPAAYGYAYEDPNGANKTLFMVIVGSLVAGLAILFVAVRQWKARQGVFM